MKSKFNSDDELPLNKTIEILSTIIVDRAVFHENNKYYLQVFLDECLYKLSTQMKQKSLYFTCLFIDYHSIIDSF